jgi:hypothetical protein
LSWLSTTRKKKNQKTIFSLAVISLNLKKGKMTNKMGENGLKKSNPGKDNKMGSGI